MKKNKWETRVVDIIIITCIVVFLALIQQDNQAASTSLYERIIKFVVLGLVAGGTLLFFIIPKTGLASKITLSVRAFIATSVVGLICGLAGIAATLIWPEKMIEFHIFELIIIPFGLMYSYWGLVMRINKMESLEEVLDERQIDNLKQAAATTLGIVTTFFLLFYFAVSGEKTVPRADIWFLIYFFLCMLIFSGTTIYYFLRK